MKNNKIKSMNGLNSSSNKDDTSSEANDIKIEAQNLQQHDTTVNTTFYTKSNKKRGKTILSLLQAGGDDFMHLVKSLDTSCNNGVDQQAWMHWRK